MVLVVSNEQLVPEVLRCRWGCRPCRHKAWLQSVCLTIGCARYLIARQLSHFSSEVVCPTSGTKIAWIKADPRVQMWIRVEVTNRFVAVRNWEIQRIQLPHDLEDIKCQQSGLVCNLDIGILHVLPLLDLWVIWTQNASHSSVDITSLRRWRYTPDWNFEVRGWFTQVR